MPRIPPPRIDTVLPETADLRRIDQAGFAMREVGKLASGVGDSMVRLRMAEQDANDSTWMIDARARAEREMLDNFESFKQEHASDPMGKAELFEKQMQERWGEIAEEAPSTRARNKFDELRGGLVNKAYAQARTWQTEQNVTNFGGRLDSTQDSLTALAFRAGSADELADLYAQAEAAADAGSTFLDPNKVDTVKQNMRQSVAQAYLSNATDRNPQAAIRELDNKAFDGIVDPAKLATYRSQAQAEIRKQESIARQRQAIVRAETTQAVQGALAMLQSGQDVDISRINFNNLPEASRGLYKDALLQAKDFVGTFNEIKYADPADVETMLTEQRKTLANAAPAQYKAKEKQVRNLERAVAARYSELNKDPYSFVAQSPAMTELAEQITLAPDEPTREELTRRYSQTLVAEQRRLGVPYQNVAVMPKEQAEAIVSSLTGPIEANQAIGTLRSLANVYGENYPHLHAQMVKAGLPPAMEVIAARGPENPAMATQLLQATQNQKALQEVVPTKDANSIEEQVFTALEPMAKTLRSNPNGLTKLNSYAQTAKLLAMQYKASGMSNEDAAKQAASEVLINQYEFEETYRIPKKYGTTGIQSISSEANQTMKKVIEKTQFDLPMTDIPDYEVARRLAKEDAKINMRWITTPDDQGLMLYHPARGPVLKDRKPIVIPFEDFIAKNQERRMKTPGKGYNPLLDTLFGFE